MTRNLHARLFKTNSAFAQGIIAAYVIFVGDILCVLGDLVWLLHDYIFPDQRWMYMLITGILGTAAFTIVLSGYWMFKSINIYLIKHAKIKAQRKLHKAKKVL